MKQIGGSEDFFKFISFNKSEEKYLNNPGKYSSLLFPAYLFIEIDLSTKFLYKFENAIVYSVVLQGDSN